MRLDVIAKILLWITFYKITFVRMIVSELLFQMAIFIQYGYNMHVDSYKKMKTEELWIVYSEIINELKDRNAIRTRNVTGERGEQLAIELYKSEKGYPKLQAAPESTKNVDALSRSGERYAIKTIMFPNRTTGVFYGITEDLEQIPKFEHLIVVTLDNSYQLKQVIEIDWNTFLKYKKWHSRMRAYNISLTKNLLEHAILRYGN